MFKIVGAFILLSSHMLFAQEAANELEFALGAGIAGTDEGVAARVNATLTSNQPRNRFSTEQADIQAELDILAGQPILRVRFNGRVNNFNVTIIENSNMLELNSDGFRTSSRQTDECNQNSNYCQVTSYRIALEPLALDFLANLSEQTGANSISLQVNPRLAGHLRYSVAGGEQERDAGAELHLGIMAAVGLRLGFVHQEGAVLVNTEDVIIEEANQTDAVVSPNFQLGLNLEVLRGARNNRRNGGYLDLALEVGGDVTPETRALYALSGGVGYIREFKKAENNSSRIRINQIRVGVFVQGGNTHTIDAPRYEGGAQTTISFQ